MARITVEDCIDKFESRFELVLVASNRARKIDSGESPTVEKDNDKPTVIALREIAGESLSVDSLKEKLIEEYQTVSPLDDEELSLDYSESETLINDEKTEDESQVNKGNDQINISNEVESNDDDDDEDEDKDKDKDKGDSILPNKNDEYSDILDDNNTEN